jgi:hypothetical protein
MKCGITYSSAGLGYTYFLVCSQLLELRAHMHCLDKLSTSPLRVDKSNT